VARKKRFFQTSSIESTFVRAARNPLISASAPLRLRRKNSGKPKGNPGSWAILFVSGLRLHSYGTRGERGARLFLLKQVFRG
jgi:hypothetical protein